MLWVVLLIFVFGVKEYMWFLVVIGMIGMLYICVIVGVVCKLEVFGIYFEYKEVIMVDKVMFVLM